MTIHTISRTGTRPKGETQTRAPSPASAYGYGLVLHSQCACGEPVDIEIGTVWSSRADRVRPHHPGDPGDVTLSRCRSCSGWIADTVPGAMFS